MEVLLTLRALFDRGRPLLLGGSRGGSRVAAQGAPKPPGEAFPQPCLNACSYRRGNEAPLVYRKASGERSDSTVDFVEFCIKGPLIENVNIEGFLFPAFCSEVLPRRYCQSDH